MACAPANPASVSGSAALCDRPELVYKIQGKSTEPVDNALIKTLLNAAMLLAPVLAMPQGWSATDIRGELEALVAASFSDGGPGGVVIVRRQGNTLLHRAYGMADLELSVPMTTAHKLAAGSITKPMTAAAILRLVQQKKLALDDDVRTHLPGMQPGGERMTVRQLLAHTSGFPSAVDRGDFESISKQALSLEELLSLTEGMNLHFPPGTGYRYSDSGYFLLGAIIEGISGLRYGQYMRREVFQPCGLDDTLHVDGRQIVPRRASGYSKGEHGFVNAPYIDMSIPYSAGGIYTTVEDLADWIGVLRSGQFIDPDLLDLAWSPPRLPSGIPTGYGLGWNVCEIAGHRSIGHGGFINGFTANLEHLPEAEITIAVMTNQDAGEPEASYLVRRIARLLITGQSELQQVSLSETHRSALTGSYVYPNGDRRLIFEQAGALWSRRNDRDPIRLVPLTPTFLAFPDTEGTLGLEFVGDSADRARKVLTRLNCELLETAEVGSEAH